MVLREANDFVERWHRHSARTSNDGGKFAIGLEHEGELVGVAIVGRPIARMLQVEGAAELLRLCTSPKAPKGGAANSTPVANGYMLIRLTHTAPKTH